MDIGDWGRKMTCREAKWVTVGKRGPAGLIKSRLGVQAVDNSEDPLDVEYLGIGKQLGTDIW